MPLGMSSAAHARAVNQVQEGMRQLHRGLRLLANDVISEAKSTARVRRHKPSPGRQLHGQYIGLIRNLSTRKKAQVRAVRTRNGVEAAIRKAREMRRSAQ
jgi:hypothetical protein